MRLLEVACGNGFHTNLLRRMGLETLGVDRSHAGIAWARTHFPRSDYHCGDLFDDLPAPRASFDCVYARGCSNYHYDLMSDQATTTTRHLLDYLKPNGVFVMVIVTNLSGSKDHGRIWHNTLDDYRQHFASFGSKFSVDWIEGMAVCGLWKSGTSTA
jgi:SAM-dependent methyltransferase